MRALFVADCSRPQPPLRAEEAAGLGADALLATDPDNSRPEAEALYIVLSR